MSGGRGELDELRGQCARWRAIAQSLKPAVGFHAQLIEPLWRLGGQLVRGVPHGWQWLGLCHEQIGVHQLGQLEVRHVPDKCFGLAQRLASLTGAHQPIDLKQAGFGWCGLSLKRRQAGDLLVWCFVRRSMRLGANDSCASWGGSQAGAQYKHPSHQQAAQERCLGRRLERLAQVCGQAAKLTTHHDPALSFTINQLLPERTNSMRLPLLTLRLSAL